MSGPGGDRSPRPALTTTAFWGTVMSVGDSTVEYREIPGYPGYRAGSDGTIWSCWRQTRAPVGRGFITFQSDEWVQVFGEVRARNTDNYRYISIRSSAGNRQAVAAHRLVLLAFVGPPPTPKHQACHYDGNRLNKQIETLRWDTSKNNHAETKRHGTWPSGEVNRAAKITANDVRLIRATFAAIPRHPGGKLKSQQLQSAIASFCYLGICEILIAQTGRSKKGCNQV